MTCPSVLLVNPWIHDFAAYDFWMKPLGLLYLGAVLRQSGFDVSLFDCTDRFHPALAKYKSHDFPKSKPDGRGKLFRQEIEKPPVLKDIPKKFCRYGITPEIFRTGLAELKPPSAILVTSHMTYWYTGVRETISDLKEAFPGVPVILGGVYASLLPEHAKNNTGADAVITGACEDRIHDAVCDITGMPTGEKHSYSGLDDYPLPAFDLLRNRDALPVLTSRGCPFRCAYCASSRLYPGFIQRSPEKVVDEIEHHHRSFGTVNFAFYDDALLVGKNKHIHIILEGIIRRNIRASFHLPNAVHGREIDLETAELMYRAGIRTVRIGYETHDVKMQVKSGGKIYTGELVEAVNNLVKAGYIRKNIGIYILMGIPGQNATDVEKAIRFIHNIGCETRLASYTPIPGTVWSNSAVRIAPEIEDEPLLHNDSIFPLRNKDMSLADFSSLKDLARKLNASL